MKTTTKEKMETTTKGTINTKQKTKIEVTNRKRRWCGCRQSRKMASLNNSHIRKDQIKRKERKEELAPD